MSDITKKVQDDGVMFIELEFTDIFGVLKSIEVPVGMLEEALERGVWFDGSSIRGFARIMESDMYLMPDPATYAVLPVDGEPGQRHCCLPQGHPTVVGGDQGMLEHLEVGTCQ